MENPRLEDSLEYNGRRQSIKIAAFDRSPLLKQSPLANIGGNKLGSLVGVFVLKVTANSATLIYNKSIVILRSEDNQAIGIQKTGLLTR
jgi:hypothetical protein